MMKLLYLLLLGLIAIPTFADAVESEPQAKLVATLQRVQHNPQSPLLVPLRLTVENIGEAPVSLVRLRSRSFEKYAGWYFWSIQIDGPHGKWGFVGTPIIPEPLTDSKMIELLPGESFSVLIDVGHAYNFEEILHTPAKSMRLLSETEGKYTITVSYAPSKDHFAFAKQDNVTLQFVQSNTVELTIDK